MTIATVLPALCTSRASHDRVREAVDAHYDGLWRFLRRMGVEERHVEDAVQEVFLVFARRAALVALEVERSFLFGIALRVASDFRRKAQRALEVADKGSLISTAHPGMDAEEALAQRELLRCLDRVLEELPPPVRAVFVLAELEELTMIEISGVLRIPQGTVASRLRRARELFEAQANALKARLDAPAL